MAGLASRIGGLLDWLADGVGYNFIFRLQVQILSPHPIDLPYYS